MRQFALPRRLAIDGDVLVWATRVGAMPNSLLGTAIGYTTNNWAALVRYRDTGHLALDNNLSERTLRAVPVGRNNWCVAGSEVGG
jgi:transposase